MTRLQSERARLYLPVSKHLPGTATEAEGLIDPDGKVRALVFELGHPADWDAMSTVWRGVQRDLALPAPAIAISGTDGFQLWFSLEDPVDVPQAHAFLNALRARFLPGLPPHRTHLMPVTDASSPHLARHAPVVPLQKETGNWSAFVAPDLAPVFVDTPWLDIEPSEEGQADLLRGLNSIRRAEWEAALAQLGPTMPSSLARTPAAQAPDKATTTSTPCDDPKSFLLRVMNDETVALALRIEAAKALLPQVDDPGPQAGS